MLSKKNLLNYLPLILVILLASILRLLWLDKVPNAIGGDELIYVITAKSMALSGSDLTGIWNPLSVFLFNYPPGQGQAELLYFLLLPVVGFTNFSLFTARVTNAIFGIFTVYLIYLIVSKIFDRKVGIVAGLIASINPWLIYISRTAYEAGIATFFYLLAFYGFMFFKGKKILLLIPILFLAFYSYIGTKVLFLPFILIMFFYSYFYINKNKYKKEYLTVLILSAALFFLFVSNAFVHPGTSRAGDLFLPNNPSIVKQVDGIRSLSIKNPLTDLFVNKYTVYSETILVKLFSIFSANYLFLNGDSFFSIYSNGVFYYLDALFLILGLVFVFNKQRKLFFLLSLVIILSTLPHLIYKADTANFTPHQSLMFPFMIIFIAAGIYGTINYFKKKSYFYVSSLVIFILYLLLTLNFMNTYFYQWTLQGNFDFPIRLVSKYAKLAEQNNAKVLIYSTEKEDIFTKYLFYSNSLNKNTYGIIRQNIGNKNYEIGNVEFLGCDNSIDPKKTKDVIVYDGICASVIKYAPKLTIPRLSDGGESFGIYNDNICKRYPLKPYPSGMKLSDFSIENMNAQNFCETFVTNP